MSRKRRRATADRTNAKAPPPLRFEHRTIDLILRHTWTIARGASDVKRNVLARLTFDGVEGLGEGAPNARYGEDAETVTAAVDLLARGIGADPARFDAVIDRLEDLLPDNHAAKAAVDIALHDWMAKRAEVPLYRLLGADPAHTPLTSFSIGLDALAVMQEKVREAEDFRILKIKLGLEHDRGILEAVREVTDKPLYVDVNEGWKDRALAVEMIRWMEGQGVVLVEQPLPADDLDGARFVRDRVDMPIVADEACLTLADIPRIADAYDGINVKLQKAGGLRMARRMIDKARELKMRVMLGCMIETSIGITAAAHLSPLVDHADLDGNLLIANDPFRGATVRQGKLVLPDRPGLGVEGAW